MAPTYGVKLFEKMVNESDIMNGLILETNSEFAHRLTRSNDDNSYVDFYVIDEETMAWRFRCFTGCSKVGGVAMKPVILEGWGEFVRHYGLRVKDKVILYDNQGESNVVPFVIHIRRTIRLFGVDITEAD